MRLPLFLTACLLVSSSLMPAGHGAGDAGTPSAAAGGPAPAAGEIPPSTTPPPPLRTTPSAVEVFAADALCGQPLALAVDDAGQLHAAVTARAFGRGTIPARRDQALHALDIRLRSVEERRTAVLRWLKEGRLQPFLRERADFFPAVLENPAAGSPDFLTKYGESIRLLGDLTGDGRADHAVTIADGFNDSADGIGSSLLPLAGGQWLYGCAPHLWRLEEAAGSGNPFRKHPVTAGGFAVRNDPPLHGLTALLDAPDGWIYLGIGDTGYNLTDAAGHRKRGLGSGAIFRCLPDGSGLERVATGLRRPSGLVMDASGRLLALDDGAPGGLCRLLLVIPGADFGWQAEAATASGEGPWFREGLERLTEAGAAAGAGPDNPAVPAWCLPPAAAWEGAASGLELTADGLLLAADRRDSGRGGISALRLAPQGAALRLVERRTIWQGGAVMATACGLAGNTVYFADWGETADLHSRCRIRRFTLPAARGTTEAADTGGNPADSTPPGTAAPDSIPGLLRKSIPSMSVRELKTLLSHPAPRVRLRACQRLAAMPFQDSLESLLQTARRAGPLPVRLLALHGAGIVTRQDAALLSEITAFLNDAEPEIRGVAATILGTGPRGQTPASLLRALEDEAPAVRAAAAAALARLRPPDLLHPLLEAAAANGTPADPWIRSSLAHALASCIPAPVLAESASTLPSAEARLTCVLALRRQEAPELAVFLTDSAPGIRTEAARAIHDLPVPAALPALAALLGNPGPSRPLPLPAARRALAAAWHLGTPEDAGRAAAFAIDPDTAPLLRLEALDILARWDTTPEEDPVTGRPADPLPRLPGNAVKALREACEVLKSADDPVLSARASALSESPAAQEPSAAAALTLIRDTTRPEALRLGLVRRLAARQELGAAAARSLLQLPALSPAIRAEARSALMRQEPKSAPALFTEALTAGTPAEQQAAVRALDRLPGNPAESEKLLLETARKLSQNPASAAVQVELLEAIQRRDAESRSPWRRAWEAWQASLPLDRDPAAAWRAAQEGGDPDAGRLILETSPSANCLSCHSLRGRGGVSAPDLDGVADRLTSREILESLVHPGATLAGGWQAPADPAPARAAGPDPAGQETSAPETADGSGPPPSRSPMPPAGTLLSLRELRDLTAFLSTLGAGRPPVSP